MVKKCSVCGSSSGIIIKNSDGVFCLPCFEKRSPFIDEVLRIVNHALGYNMVWVDFDAVERRERTKRDRDSMQG